MCYMLIGGRNAFESGVMLGGHNDDLFGYGADGDLSTCPP